MPSLPRSGDRFDTARHPTAPAHGSSLSARLRVRLESLASPGKVPGPVLKGHPVSYEPPSYGSPPPPPPGGGGGYGPPPGGGYGAPGPGYGGAQPQGNSVMAIISLVTGILGVLCCGSWIFAIAAIVLGVLARKEIAESGGAKSGAGMAMAGLILGAVGIVISVIWTILWITTGSFNFYTT